MCDICLCTYTYTYKYINIYIYIHTQAYAHISPTTIATHGIVFAISTIDRNKLSTRGESDDLRVYVRVFAWAREREREYLCVSEWLTYSQGSYDKASTRLLLLAAGEWWVMSGRCRWVDVIPTTSCLRLTLDLKVAEWMAVLVPGYWGLWRPLSLCICPLSYSPLTALHPNC